LRRSITGVRGRFPDPAEAIARRIAGGLVTSRPPWTLASRTVARMPWKNDPAQGGLLLTGNPSRRSAAGAVGNRRRWMRGEARTRREGANDCFTLRLRYPGFHCDGVRKHSLRAGAPAIICAAQGQLCEVRRRSAGGCAEPSDPYRRGPWGQEPPAAGNAGGGCGWRMVTHPLSPFPATTGSTTPQSAMRCLEKRCAGFSIGCVAGWPAAGVGRGKFEATLRNCLRLSESELRKHLRPEKRLSL